MTPSSPTNQPSNFDVATGSYSVSLQHFDTRLAPHQFTALTEEFCGIASIQRDKTVFIALFENPTNHKAFTRALTTFSRLPPSGKTPSTNHVPPVEQP